MDIDKYFPRRISNELVNSCDELFCLDNIHQYAS